LAWSLRIFADGEICLEEIPFQYIMTRQVVLKTNLLIVLFVLLSLLSANQIASALDVTVDASQSLGDMPQVLKPHFFSWDLQDQNNYPMQKATSDILLDSIYGTPTSVGAFNVNATSLGETMDQLKSHYAALGLDGWLKNNHINFVISISKMPRWLSSDPNNENPIIPGAPPGGDSPIWQQSPPNCYDFECVDGEGNIRKGWASLVKEIVYYFNIELGLDAPLNVWHEPSWNHFYGTQEEYFQLYKYAVIGAKAADPNIKIAGPATAGLDPKSNLDGSGYESPNPMMQDFIEYAGTHPLIYDNNEEGVHLNYDKWPVDIISFSGLNQYGSSWKNMADQIRGWLSSKGYSESAPLLVQEFGTWLDGNYLDEKRDSEYIAAYLIDQLAAMEKAAIGDYYFTTLFDFGVNETREFIGRNDLWSSHFAIKPVYNSFKALSILDGKQEGEIADRIQATFDENDFVGAIASQTRDRSKIRLILSNFIPQGKMLKQYLLGIYRTCMLSKNYTISDVTSILSSLVRTCQTTPPAGSVTMDYLVAIINQTDFSPFDNTSVRTDLSDCSVGVIQKLTDLNYYGVNPRQVTVTISGLPFSGQSTVSIYTIDRNSSNSCKANKMTEELPTGTECGINGIIDKKVQQARRDSFYAVSDYMLALHYATSTVTKFVSCLLLSDCDVQGLIDGYCRIYPNRCDQLKLDLAEAGKLKDGLFYNGSYTAATGKNYSIPIYIDKINSDPNLLKSYTNITVPLEGSKRERSITVTDGTLSGTISMLPYSVDLIEITAP
jgi:hypothetical protein